MAATVVLPRAESEPGFVVDAAALLDRFGNDVEFAREIVELFLQDCPRRVAALREALARRDSAALQFVAHSFKGSVSNFAAPDALAAALRLEVIGATSDLAHAAEACAALEREIGRLTSALIALLGPFHLDT